MSKIIEGFEIPKFTPMGRKVLIPALNNIFKPENIEDTLNADELIDSEIELSEKDFQTVVLAKGEGVTDKLEVGDKIQIVPQGDWHVSLTINDNEYFLIHDHVIVGAFK